MQKSCTNYMQEPRLIGGHKLLRSRPTAILTSSTSSLHRGAIRFRAFVPLAAKGGKGTAAKGFGAPKPTTKGIANDAPCPCGSGAVYESCCATYHRGGAASVPTPEALLRSRYSAYAAKDPTFIADTTHPDSAEYTGSRASYVSAVKQTMRRLDPQRLTIVSQEPGASPDEAFITFTLKRRIKDPEVPGSAAEVDEVTERSRFVRVGGRWFFLDSEFPDQGEAQGKEAGGAAGAGAAPQAAAAAAGQEAAKKPGFKLPFFS